jgi:hypothetical protein
MAVTLSLLPAARKASRHHTDMFQECIPWLEIGNTVQANCKQAGYADKSIPLPLPYPSPPPTWNLYPSAPSVAWNLAMVASSSFFFQLKLGLQL